MARLAAAQPDFASKQGQYRFWRHIFRDLLLRGLAFRLLARVAVIGRENLPVAGPALLIYNHMHGIDPIVIVGAVRPPFAVPLSKIENFAMPIFGTCLRLYGAYPVRRGAVDRAALGNTIALLEAGQVVLMAPEGTRQPALIRGKDGAAYMAAYTGVPIIPIGVEGTLGFGQNLKRLHRTEISLTVGRGFRFSQRGDLAREALPALTEAMMYQLAALLPAARRGHYAELANGKTDLLEWL
jgi:1-acyl-sn-glycerol-3-phosphate acyltransferase